MVKLKKIEWYLVKKVTFYFVPGQGRFGGVANLLFTTGHTQQGVSIFYNLILGRSEENGIHNK